MPFCTARTSCSYTLNFGLAWVQLLQQRGASVS
jgi:hypothetical protein